VEGGVEDDSRDRRLAVFGNSTHCIHVSVARQVDGIFIVQLELPWHFDGIALEKPNPRLLGAGRVGYGRVLVRDGANAGWINYMLKDRQKSEFDGFVDCIIIESLHNPNC